MKIDVTYDALLRALVEAVRAERDHGKALMSLVSRLVDEAGKQDWFETHWRTTARLKLAQIACGDMPKHWRSAAPVLETIAEAARWALKADEVDGDSRAALLAISRLADVERSGRAAAEPTSRPAKAARTGKVSQARRRLTTQPAKLIEAPQPVVGAKAKPAAKAVRKPAAKAVQTRKANGSAQMSRGRSKAQLAKRATPTQPAVVAKAKPAAKPVRTRKANGASQASRKRVMAQPAKPAGTLQLAPSKASPAQSAAIAKTKPATKPARTRKANRSGAASQKRMTAELAKPAAGTSRPAPVTKAQPTVKSPLASNANGSGQANPGVQGSASAT